LSPELAVNSVISGSGKKNRIEMNFIFRALSTIIIKNKWND